MIFLGFDVGSRNFGAAALEIKDGKIEIKRLEFIYLKDDYIGTRLGKLEDSLSTLFFEPLSKEIKGVTYEHPILRGSNMAGVLYTCGVIHKLTSQLSLQASPVSPSSVKKQIGTNLGKSSKEEVLAGLASHLTNFDQYLQVLSANDHVSDAVAIALCGIKK